MGAEGKYDLKLAPPDMVKKTVTKSESTASSRSTSCSSPGSMIGSRAAIHESLAAALRAEAAIVEKVCAEAVVVETAQKAKAVAESKDATAKEVCDEKEESNDENLASAKLSESESSKVEAKEQRKIPEAAATMRDKLHKDRTACKSLVDGKSM